MSAFHHHAAAFTAIPDCFAVRFIGRFKIPSAHLVDVKALRAATISQFIFGNHQMTVAAAKFLFLQLKKRKHFMFT